MTAYPIGTKYMTLGKWPRVCTIRDVLTTTNSNGETVKIEYLSDAVFVGAIIEHRDCAVGVARGIARLTACRNSV